MSTFWSIWIMALVVINMGITLFLFLWGQRVKIPVLPDGTTGHVWAHGVLRESVRTLPRWWVWMSASMFAVGFIYLALYPGFGSHAGLLGWTSQGELARDVAANQAIAREYNAYYLTVEPAELASNPAAVKLGERVFIDNCAACHGRAGQGNPRLGAPSLVDADWLYGGDDATIRTSILNGRHGTMPPLGEALGEAGVNEVAHYVLGLSGAAHDAQAAAAGQAKFALCAACHGMDGKGNPALGAPNLTDTAWLYGGDLETIKQTIQAGRSGVMPAWQSRLDAVDLHLLLTWMRAQAQTD
jgi:cytochrome c oxidase cbb3-type subunit 3